MIKKILVLLLGIVVVLAIGSVLTVLAYHDRIFEAATNGVSAVVGFVQSDQSKVLIDRLNQILKLLAKFGGE